MQRITVSIDAALAEAFDEVVGAQGYASRSEAMRDLLRQAVEARRSQTTSGACVASLSYVFNHHVRALAQRLTTIAHANHDLIVASTHVHLDHENCLESVILKGDTDRVRAYADRVRAERGVAFGDLNLIGVSAGDAHEGPAHRHDGHAHLTPRHTARQGARRGS